MLKVGPTLQERALSVLSKMGAYARLSPQSNPSWTLESFPPNQARFASSLVGGLSNLIDNDPALPNLQFT